MIIKQTRPFTALNTRPKIHFDQLKNVHYYINQNGAMTQVNRAGDTIPQFVYGVSGSSNYKSRILKSQSNQKLKYKRPNLTYQKQNGFISPQGSKLFGYSQFPYKINDENMQFLAQDNYKTAKRKRVRESKQNLYSSKEKNLKGIQTQQTKKSKHTYTLSVCLHEKDKLREQKQTKNNNLRLVSAKQNRQLSQSFKSKTFYDNNYSELQKKSTYNSNRLLKKNHHSSQHHFCKLDNAAQSQIKMMCMETFKQAQSKLSFQGFSTTAHSTNLDQSKSKNYFKQVLLRSKQLTHYHNKSTFSNCYNKKCHTNYKKLQSNKFKPLNNTVGLSFHQKSLKLQKQQIKKYKNSNFLMKS